MCIRDSHDRSGWRAYSQTYMTMQCPLWIIAEDAATGRRLWITQEGTRFSISIRRMDEQGRNYGPTYRITCETVSYTHLDVYKRQALEGIGYNILSMPRQQWNRINQMAA